MGWIDAIRVMLRRLAAWGRMTAVRTGMRQSDVVELYCVGLGLVGLATYFVGTLNAQPAQEVVNAQIRGEINLLAWRLSRLEGWMSAAMLALIANFCAHVIQIRTQTRRRNRRGAEED